jgi:hypothetical protein
METMNKLGANMTCISSAEKLYTAAQSREAQQEGVVPDESPKSGAHIDLSA